MLTELLDKLADLQHEADAAWDAETHDLLNDELSRRSLEARIALTAAARELGESLVAVVSSKADASTTRAVAAAFYSAATTRAQISEQRIPSTAPRDAAAQDQINAAVQNLFRPIRQAHESLQTTTTGQPMDRLWEQFRAHDQAVNALVGAVTANSDLVSLFRASEILGEAFGRVTQLADEHRRDFLSK